MAKKRISEGMRVKSKRTEGKTYTVMKVGPELIYLEAIKASVGRKKVRAMKDKFWGSYDLLSAPEKRQDPSSTKDLGQVRECAAGAYNQTKRNAETLLRIRKDITELDDKLDKILEMWS